MPATGREFNRRTLLLVALAAIPLQLRADSADEVWELLGLMASALANGIGAEFFGYFDRRMPGYDEFRTNVTALLTHADVQSSLDLVSNDGDDRKRTVEVDWLLRTTSQDKDSASDAEKREERVKCRFEKQGKHWRVVSLEPISFFAPPRPK